MKYSPLLALAMLSACGDAGQEVAAPVGPPVEMTSEELAKKYAENEVAAKGELDGKTLVITGKISSIELDVMDKPTVSLPGTDDFTMVIANFTEEAQAKTASLKKGSEIKLSCSGVEEMMGSPMLQECTF